jgi:DNA topoisomerase-2
MEDRYKVSGKIEKLDDNTIEITELPIRSWTQSYKEQLESWVQGTEKVPAFIKVCELHDCVVALSNLCTSIGL